MEALVYDLEIGKAIPSKKESRIADIEYCDGWHDHANMGISVLCAQEIRCAGGRVECGRMRVFCSDNADEFKQATDEVDLLVSFNGLGFDRQVVRSVWNMSLYPPEFDILAEMWAAAGLTREFQYPSHLGFGLDATAKANFRGHKTGSGALAPVEWQRGRIGSVIDYCCQDVALTARLFRLACEVGYLRDPRNPSAVLDLKHPYRIM